jgi:hypothetical protein
LPEQEERRSGNGLWIFSGDGSHSDVDCLFLFQNDRPSDGQEDKESAMIFDSDAVPVTLVAELLKASAITGFTLAEIEALVNSELETNHLLEYITAVVSRRMN